MTGVYAQMLFQFLKNNISATGILNIKGFHFVMESRTPSIYKHTLNSFLQGQPEILHYDSDLTRRSERRKEALQGKDAMRTKGVTSLDEYPFASTFEGGKDANVAAVPIIEQSYQGADLRWNVYAHLKSGDAFMVLPVPEGKEPETVKQEALSRLPQSAPILSPAGSPNFSRPAVPYNLWPAVLGAGVAIGVGMYMRYFPIP